MSKQVRQVSDTARRWVVMGVCGCGKSEMGRRLGARLRCTYLEGDDFHPPANIAKMRDGIPLGDDDRHGWLLRLQDKIREAAESGESLIISCSALKRRYRDLLREGDPQLMFVHLQGELEVIASRMRARPSHFMPLSLLDSQFRDLEPLAADEAGITLDIRSGPEQLIAEFFRQLSNQGTREKDVAGKTSSLGTH